MKTVFLRVLAAQDKATALLDVVRDPDRARGRQRFEVDPLSFASVPRSPFAYWVTERLRGVFSKLSPFEADGRAARQGGITGDDFRWMRLWYEVPRSIPSGVSYIPIAKGGRRATYFGNRPVVARWDFSRNTFHAFTGLPHRPSLQPASFPFYFRPGLTWPLRGIRFSAQAVPGDGIFSVGGKMAFCSPERDPLPWLAVFNSLPFDGLIAFFAGKVGGVQYEVGLIQFVPVPMLSEVDASELGSRAGRAWSLKRSLDTRTEISHAFTLPALLQAAGADVAARAVAWSEHVRAVEAELVAIQAEIDERCFVLYGIDEADRRAITEGFGGNSTEAELSGDADEAEDEAVDDGEEDDSAADAESLVAELVSWAVGVAFGRFDLRLATGVRPMPKEPEPFDPLPACSPGTLTGGDGLPLARPPAGYALAFAEAGVLVDDPGHAQDLTAAVRAVFDVVFGAEADRWWNDVAALLDPKGHDLRGWLADGFFEHHLKRYSKSRRKAPIVWQLGTPSGRYSTWLYAHRLTRDSFFQLQNEVIGPKLAHEERQLTSLTQNAGGSPSAQERKQIAAQEAIVEELRTMLDEIKRVASLWNPNLDDGVVLTMAPLWRLVPQHKPWQKELKARWGELAAGKYDWAHLAMHLWSERVVPKCATDRSLAIAHGLEDVFWVEGSDGKWKARATPTRPAGEIVRERSSPAVKAALKSLLDAPVGSTAAQRGRATRFELSA